MKELLLLFVLMPSLLMANENFDRNFNVIKEDGRVITIKPKTNFSFSMRPYLSFIKSKIIQEQEAMKAKADYFYEAEEMLLEGQSKSGRESGEVGRTILALKKLSELQVEIIFSNSAFLKVMEAFEVKLSSALLDTGLNTLVRPGDATYFYKRNRVLQIIKWGISLAKKQLSTLPLLNTATYVISEVVKMLERRRDFYQNMMLHYFERFSPEELGLTKEDVDYSFSSIYESKIHMFFKFESNLAQRTWEHYGTDKFYRGFRLATSRLFKNRARYSSIGERVNFAFQEAEIDGEAVILNLNNKVNVFDSSPAIAYYFKAPQKVKRKRTILMLAKLGLSFVQLPSIIKSVTETYLNSQYEAHQITEGALIAYLENIGDDLLYRDILSQNLNPYY